MGCSAAQRTFAAMEAAMSDALPPRSLMTSVRFICLAMSNAVSPYCDGEGCEGGGGGRRPGGGAWPREQLAYAAAAARGPPAPTQRRQSSQGVVDEEARRAGCRPGDSPPPKPWRLDAEGCSRRTAWVVYLCTIIVCACNKKCDFKVRRFLSPCSPDHLCCSRACANKYYYHTGHDNHIKFGTCGRQRLGVAGVSCQRAVA